MDPQILAWKIWNLAQESIFLILEQKTIVRFLG